MYVKDFFHPLQYITFNRWRSVFLNRLVQILNVRPHECSPRNVLLWQLFTLLARPLDNTGSTAFHHERRANVLFSVFISLAPREIRKNRKEPVRARSSNLLSVGAFSYGTKLVNGGTLEEISRFSDSVFSIVLIN